MRTNAEFTIEFDDHDLMELPDPASVEIDDIELAQVAPTRPAHTPCTESANDVIEIELSAAEIDDLLSGV